MTRVWCLPHGAEA